MAESRDRSNGHRHSDEIVLTLVQKLTDFIERYDRDVGALNEWRILIDKQLKGQDEILGHISPAYRRGMWVVGLIVIGTIALAVQKFWSHISFGDK